MALSFGAAFKRTIYHNIYEGQRCRLFSVSKSLLCQIDPSCGARGSRTPHQSESRRLTTRGGRGRRGVGRWWWRRVRFGDDAASAVHWRADVDCIYSAIFAARQTGIDPRARDVQHQLLPCPIFLGGAFAYGSCGLLYPQRWTAVKFLQIVFPADLLGLLLDLASPSMHFFDGGWLRKAEFLHKSITSSGVWMRISGQPSRALTSLICCTRRTFTKCFMFQLTTTSRR